MAQCKDGEDAHPLPHQADTLAILGEMSFSPQWT